MCEDNEWDEKKNIYTRYATRERYVNCCCCSFTPFRTAVLCVGDKPLKFQVVCPQNGTAVLKGLKATGGEINTRKILGKIKNEEPGSGTIWCGLITTIK